MKAHLVINLILSAILSACGSEIFERSDLSLDKEFKNSRNLESPEPIENYFRVFDPNYPFRYATKNQPEDLSEQFPIFHNAEVSFIPSDQFFTLRINMIRNAKKSLRIQTIIFGSDEAGYVMAEELKKAAERGVEVTIILDPIVNYESDKHRVYYDLQKAGIKVEGLELYFQKLINLGNIFDFMDTFDDMNRRYHDKLFISDAELPDETLAIIGGTNIKNEYFRINERNWPLKNWEDRDILLRGPVVNELTAYFDRTLEDFIAERDKVSYTEKLVEFMASMSSGEDILKGLNSMLIQKLYAHADSRPKYDWKPCELRFIFSRPRYQEDYIYPVHLDMIRDAKKTVQLTNSYFIPEPDLMDEFKRALARGVDIKILTNSEYSADDQNIIAVQRARYKQLLDLNQFATGTAQLEIYEWLSDEILQNGEGMNHSKYLIIDERATLVGSFNIDPRSHHLNSESVVIFWGEESTRPHAREFTLGLDPKFSERVSYTTAIGYEDPEGLWDKFYLKISELIKPILLE